MRNAKILVVLSLILALALVIWLVPRMVRRGSQPFGTAASTVTATAGSSVSRGLGVTPTTAERQFVPGIGMPGDATTRGAPNETLTPLTGVGGAYAATPARVTQGPPTAGATLAIRRASPSSTLTRDLRTATRAPTASSGLPRVALRDLPPEAAETVQVIEKGPPFPYDRDGITFQNLERRLPLKERGYYREFTVRTPGSRDRGARRIIVGKAGEMYYTDDHYESFKEIVR